MKKFLSFATILLLILCSIATFVGYLGTYNWFFDLFSHFKFQYFVLLISGSVILLFLKRRIVFYFLPFIILTGIEIVPLYFGGFKDFKNPKTVKIVSINLLTSNGEFELVKTLINRENPDILILQELTELWQIMLEPILASYRDRTVVPRPDSFGMGLYSRFKLSSSQLINIGKEGTPSVEAKLKLDKDSLIIIATHPLPPVGQSYFDSRNEHLVDLSTLANTYNQELVIIGDLNSSSFSNHFKRLMNNSDLIDSRKGFGILPTWPTWFSPAQTTLDHCLITDGLFIKSRRVGEHIGSDHLPIIVEIGIIGTAPDQ